MISSDRYFFDIPVYRLTEEQYYQGMEKYVGRVLFPPDDQISRIGRVIDVGLSDDSIGDHLRKKYGGGWRFNEVVGFIRLFFLGSQVRGEYFGVGLKKIRKTRTKTFELMSLNLVIEIEIGRPLSNATILEAIFAYLAECRKQLKHRYIDSELLEQLGPYIDWQRFVMNE